MMTTVTPRARRSTTVRTIVVAFALCATVAIGGCASVGDAPVEDRSIVSPYAEPSTRDRPIADDRRAPRDDLDDGATTRAIPLRDDGAPTRATPLRDGTATSTTISTTAPPSGDYIVAPGDTLYGIAFRNGLDFRALAQWNAIAAPYTIKTGQRLRLSPPGAPAIATSPARDPAPGTSRPPVDDASSTAPRTATPIGEPSRDDAPIATAPIATPPADAGVQRLPPNVEPLRDAPVAPRDPSVGAAPVGATPTPSPASPSSSPRAPATAPSSPSGAVSAAIAGQPRQQATPVQPVAPLVAPVPDKPVATNTPATPTTPAPEAMRVDGAIIDTGPTQTVGGIRWRWPARGNVVARFTAGDPARQGVDIQGTIGQPVAAAADGEVVYSGNGLLGYGELIIIKHSPEFLSAYGYNRKRLVGEGDRVKAGQAIAEMGQTGAAVSVVHFEIRQAGKPVDPLRFLPRR